MVGPSRGRSSTWSNDRDDFSSTAIRWSTSGGDVEIPCKVEEELFAIAQEALTNALKHATAAAIHVALSLDGSGVSITVRDNGIGFETASVPSQKV